jgi:hypothetical protein
MHGLGIEGITIRFSEREMTAGKGDNTATPARPAASTSAPSSTSETRFPLRRSCFGIGREHFPSQFRRCCSCAHKNPECLGSQLGYGFSNEKAPFD